MYIFYCKKQARQINTSLWDRYNTGGMTEKAERLFCIVAVVDRLEVNVNPKCIV